MDPDTYKLKVSGKRGFLVIIDIRSKVDKKFLEKYKNDHDILKGLAKYLDFECIIYDDIKNSSVLHIRRRHFKEYVSQIATFINNHSDKADCLILFLLAECKNVDDDLTFLFFEDYKINKEMYRMEIRLGDITQPFLPSECEGLLDKPKVFFIHAPETFQDNREFVKSKDDTRARMYVDSLPKTVNHADFFICISRPKITKDTAGSHSLFLKLLWSIINKSDPQYEINEIIMVLQQEMLKVNDYDQKRLWNCSKLRKKLVLKKVVENFKNE